MKKIYSILLISVLFLSSCWKDNNEYQSWYYDNTEVKQNCYKPSNPYNDWSWHYAWFERAEEKGRICSWNSDSFINWCEEYYSQLSDYNNCKNK